MLLDLGHDVVSAHDEFARASDETLLALAYEERRVLVTEDKDFGELVFVRRLPHPCIVRFVEMSIVGKLAAMREGALIVVTRDRVRIRGGRPWNPNGRDE